MSFFNSFKMNTLRIIIAITVLVCHCEPAIAQHRHCEPERVRSLPVRGSEGEAIPLRGGSAISTLAVRPARETIFSVYKAPIDPPKPAKNRRGSALQIPGWLRNFALVAGLTVGAILSTGCTPKPASRSWNASSDDSDTPDTPVRNNNTATRGNTTAPIISTSTLTQQNTNINLQVRFNNEMDNITGEFLAPQSAVVINNWNSMRGHKLEKTAANVPELGNYLSGFDWNARAISSALRDHVTAHPPTIAERDALVTFIYRYVKGHHIYEAGTDKNHLPPIDSPVIINQRHLNCQRATELIIGFTDYIGIKNMIAATPVDQDHHGNPVDHVCAVYFTEDGAGGQKAVILDTSVHRTDDSIENLFEQFSHWSMGVYFGNRFRFLSFSELQEKLAAGQLKVRGVDIAIGNNIKFRTTHYAKFVEQRIDAMIGSGDLEGVLTLIEPAIQFYQLYQNQYFSGSPKRAQYHSGLLASLQEARRKAIKNISDTAGTETIRESVSVVSVVDTYNEAMGLYNEATKLNNEVHDFDAALVKLQEARVLYDTIQGQEIPFHEGKVAKFGANIERFRKLIKGNKEVDPALVDPANPSRMQDA